MEKSKTKIVATIGPSTWDEHIILEMVDCGLSVARINASFADAAEIQRVTKLFRRLAPDVAVMVDTMGYKVRLKNLNEDKTVTKDEEISIEITYDNPTEIPAGTTLLIDDGKVNLTVLSVKEGVLKCKVVMGGVLKPKKTVNIPGVHLNFPDLTDKDKEDIKAAIENQADYVCASFVRDVKDVKEFRKYLTDPNIKLIAKIEDQEGVDNFDEILEQVDGIMVARGDLGVELPIETVPGLQKRFIHKCRNKGKVVIVATQMLESMRENATPTRAEVSDIANAIYDGTDAIMLSAETSTGKYPVEAVKVMRNVAFQAELDSMTRIEPVIGFTEASPEANVLCIELSDLVKKLSIKCVIVLSAVGRTTRSLTRHRVTVPVWSIASSERLARQENMLFGVTSFYRDHFANDRDQLIKESVAFIRSKGLLEFEDKVAIIAGSSVKGKSTNSILEILAVKDILVEESPSISETSNNEDSTEEKAPYFI